MARVVVTGGLGFVGSNAAHAFCGRGDEVLCLDACLDPYGWNDANIAGTPARFEQGDVRDIDFLKQALAEADVVVHCAGQVSHTLSVERPVYDVEMNVIGAIHVLEAGRAVCPKARFVNVSTRGVVGRMTRATIDEDHPAEPTDALGIGKLAAEKYFALYARIHGLSTVSLRLTNTYGERSQMRHGDFGIANWFIRCALRGEPITLHGGGRETRDWCYVGDVARAIVRAAAADAAGVFNVASGVSTSFADLAAKVVAIAESKSAITDVPRPEARARIETGDTAMSIERIRKALQWRPEVALDDGLKRTIAFYREHLDEYV